MTKKEVFGIELQQYLNANKEQKGEILDTLERQTGMLRKSIIRRLRREQLRHAGDKRKVGPREYYGPDVTYALKEIWEACGELCGELTHPCISDYIDIFMRDGTWKHGDIVTSKLRAISEATVKRRIANFTKARTGKGKSTTNPSAIKERIPVFCGPWGDVPPGHGQIDTVVHCGSTLAGMMVFSTSYTDVCTGWWRARAQWGKGMESTRNSLSHIKETLMIPWFHAHPDCGSEFLNQFVVTWAQDNKMEFTRSRSYHKNDNAYVEQKNGHIIRKEIGYRRLDAHKVVDVMSELYEKLALHRNFFVPQRKLVSRERHGAKYKKKYDKAKTPMARVLLQDSVSPKVKESLTQFRATLNPQVLREEIASLKSTLFKIQDIHGSDVR
jgi:hypothetical protein